MADPHNVRSDSFIKEKKYLFWQKEIERQTYFTVNIKQNKGHQYKNKRRKSDTALLPLYFEFVRSAVL